MSKKRRLFVAFALSLLGFAFVWFFSSNDSPFVQWYFDNREPLPLITSILRGGSDSPVLFFAFGFFPLLAMIVLNNPELPGPLALVLLTLQWTLYFYILLWIIEKIRALIIGRA